MKERITKILELVAAGRLGHDDAAQLLQALSPKLALSEEARPHVFGLLNAPDFGVDKVADLLLATLSPTPSFVVGGRRTPFPKGDFSFGFEDLGQRISSVVESALEGSMGARGAASGKPGRTLRASGEDSDGNEFTVNIPLALAEHADKLLPPLAWKLLERQGMTPEALRLLLKSNPPIGPLLQSEDSDGNELQLVIVA
ncbi:hypothetical protein [Deinococcus yavapaiensis]|uniref:Uncharacterized protein n=1 Tax=Deinococcus yavapaiensis KR-236 TaxID=694435 RepID=A0A318S6K6_9DEIO|nr:hypothetical protein [Deinococcus yavapaiensis]PYE50020.1 hypothetical protein DES52_11941 [Deinococcus yavapaiensis KR-236]